jgi:hypothetical protein
MPAITELVAITPTRKPLIIESLAFPNQSEEQKQASNRGCDKPPGVEIHLRENNQIEE